MSDTISDPMGKRLLDTAPPQIEASVAAGDVLHFWARAVGDGTAPPEVSIDGTPVGKRFDPLTARYGFFEVELPRAGHLTLGWDEAATLVSVATVHHPAKVLNEGLRVLHVHPQTTAPELAHNIHFRPPFGWMNDPNGFVFHDGLYHLCYQHYPHVPQWNLMHWGHAVSDDLIRWRHLPVMIHPERDLFPDDDRSGGAYSGSAISQPGGMRMYYTDRKLDRAPEDQFQRTVLSRDGVTAGAAVTVVPRRPDLPGLTPDFRDPYVFTGPDGRLKMLVGSKDGEGGVVLLFETEEAEGDAGWRFVSILHKQVESPRSVCECPCMVDLGGGLWALVYGMLSSTDPATGKRNISTALVGGFDGATFTPQHAQELDFGSDAYGFQATPTPDGPVGIAWLANWAALVKTTRTPTAMTLPRRMIWDGTRLCLPPVAAVDTLRAETLPGDALMRGEDVPLDGAVEIELDLPSPGAAFRLAFAQADLDLGLACGPDGLEILHRSGAENEPRYIALGAAPTRLRVFLDAGSIEVFADDGRWAGTKRLASLAPITGVRLTGGTLVGARLHRLAL